MPIEGLVWMVTSLFVLFIGMFLVSLPISLIAGKMLEMREEKRERQNKVEKWEDGETPNWR